MSAAALALAATTLAACGNGAQPASEHSSERQLVAETPAGTKPVTQVTWNLLREPTTVDPIKSQTEAEGPVVGNMCESLLTVNSAFQLQPGLAESFEMTDPTTWVYRIRDGVKFWDGKPVTTDDVVYSLQRSFGTTSTKSGSFYPTYFTRVKAIKASGANEVTISLTEPDALFNRILATPAGAVVEKTFASREGADFGTPTVGVMCSGPFKFSRWTPGRELTLEKNDAYWDAERVPKVERLTFKFIDNDATAAAALQSGEVDGMYEVPVSSVPRLKRANAGTLRFGPGPRFLAIFPTEKSALREQKLREALYLAMDRAAIAKQIFPDVAEPMKSLTPPVFAYGEDTFQQYLDSRPDPNAKTDLDKARLLVQGIDESERNLTLATESTPSTVAVANQIQSQGKKIGLNVEVEVLTPNQNEALYFDKKLRTSYDGFLAYTWTYNADPLDFLVYFTPASYYNYGLYDNKEFSDRFEDALGTYDDAQRATEVVEAYKVVDRDLPWIPIIYEPNRLYMSNQLTGAPPSWAYVWSAWAARLGGK